MAGRRGPSSANEWPRFPVTLTEVPLEGLEDIRVGIDLMGPGEVWIDDVEVYDLLFEEQERIELIKIGASAHANLGVGKLLASQALLDGYWPNVPQKARSPARTAPRSRVCPAQASRARGRRPDAHAGRQSAAGPFELGPADLDSEKMVVTV